MNAKLIKRGQDDSANLGSANQITCQGFAKKSSVVPVLKNQLIAKLMSRRHFASRSENSC